MGGTSYDAEMPTDIPDGFIVIRDRTHPGGYRAVDPATITGGGGGGGGTPFGMRSLTSYGITRTPISWLHTDVDKVLYTCPAGKQAVGLDVNESNGVNFFRLVDQPLGPVPMMVTTPNGSALASFKFNAQDIGDINAGVGPNGFTATTVGQMPTFFGPGDELKVTGGGADDVTAGLLVMLEVNPAESGIVYVAGNTPVVADTVVYTVPAGKNALILGGPSEMIFFGRTVAATPATHIHGTYHDATPGGLGSVDISPGGFFEGSLAGGSDGGGTTNVNNLIGLLGPGDTIALWQDNTGFQTAYAFAVQEF